MFTLLFGVAIGYSAFYIRQRFGVGIKMKIERVEKEIENKLKS